MYNSQEIGDRIRDAARCKGITVTAMLEAAGVSRNFMTMTRTSFPKSDTLAKIADVLGVSVDYLLGRKDTPEI